jgi:excisionase family DNA binding protein
MEMLTTIEAAALLKVHRETVLRWIRRGRVRGVKLSRTWRVPASEVERLLSEGLDGRSDRGGVDPGAELPSSLADVRLGAVPAADPARRRGSAGLSGSLADDEPIPTRPAYEAHYDPARLRTPRIIG